MEKLIVDNLTTISKLEEFCGDKLKCYTGKTQIITPDGDKSIQFGSVITKHEDGTFSVEY